MLTALQSARVDVANKLIAARESLLSTRSSIVWVNGEHKIVNELVSSIDFLIAIAVPNARE